MWCTRESTETLSDMERAPSITPRSASLTLFTLPFTPTSLFPHSLTPYSLTLHPSDASHHPFSCPLIPPQGSRLEGTFKDNAPHAKCTYFYPDHSVLKGQWKNGEMVSAKFYETADAKMGSKETFTYDQSSREHLSRAPLLRDPYETKWVYVKPSTVPGAGEGLFAKIDIPEDTVCSFYNGIRVSLKQTNKQTWRENANNISLNNGTCIDIPPEWNETSVYCATLGHKANHHPNNNAMYDTFYNHPRFGKIKCIRTIRDVKKDEEIFVDYGYKKGNGPQWYRAYYAKQS